MTLIKNIQAGELKKQLDKTEWENLTDLTVIGPIDFSDWPNSRFVCFRPKPVRNVPKQQPRTLG